MKDVFRKPLLYVLILTFLGAVLRFYHLGFKSLWLDEVVIYLNSTGGLSEVFCKNALRNSAPPTFTLLINAISYIGNSEFWLRLPSCLAGILSIPMAYLTFKRFAGKWGSLLGCLLLAFSPMQIKYSQEVREYSFVVLLTLVLIYFMYRAIECKDSKYCLLFGLAAAIAIQFQYGLVLVIAVFSAIILLYYIIDKNKKTGLFFICLVPILLSILMVWYISLRHQYKQGGFASSTYLSSAYFDGSVANLPGFCIYNTESVLRFAFNAECKSLLLLLVVIGCCYSFFRKRYLPLIVTVGLFGVTLLAGILSLYPYGGIRQAVFLSVPLYLMASVGTYYLQNKKSYCVIGALTILFLIYGTMDSFGYLNRESQENVKPILTILDKDFQLEDLVFVSPGSEPAFEYYFNSLTDNLIFPLDFYNKQREFDYKRYADIIGTQTGRIWLIFTHYQPQDMETMIRTIKEKRKVRLVSPVGDYVKLYLVADEAPANSN